MWTVHRKYDDIIDFPAWNDNTKPHFSSWRDIINYELFVVELRHSSVRCSSWRHDEVWTFHHRERHIIDKCIEREEAALDCQLFIVERRHYELWTIYRGGATLWIVNYLSWRGDIIDCKLFIMEGQHYRLWTIYRGGATLWTVNYLSWRGNIIECELFIVEGRHYRLWTIYRGGATLWIVNYLSWRGDIIDCELFIVERRHYELWTIYRGGATL